jgi:RAD51-like protein 2
MQLCANVQIPSDQGGIQGSAIYLDTEGSFLPKRMMQIAQATLDSYPTQTGTCKADVELDWSVMLQNIILYRATNVSELLASIIQIEQQLQSNSDIKLIVIDSIAFHFRSLVNFQERTRILNRITQTLRKLASQHQIAIVMTNQMTTKIGDSRVGGNSMMVPALGESFGHAATHRIILLWRKNVRHAWLCKSSTFQEALVPFAITVYIKLIVGSRNERFIISVPCISCCITSLATVL